MTQVVMKSLDKGEELGGGNNGSIPVEVAKGWIRNMVFVVAADELLDDLVLMAMSAVPAGQVIGI
jgi:hypothetical protein